MEKEKKSWKASIKSTLERIGSGFMTLTRACFGSSETLKKSIITTSKRILTLLGILVVSYIVFSFGFSIGYTQGYLAGKLTAFKEFVNMMVK